MVLSILPQIRLRWVGNVSLPERESHGDNLAKAYSPANKTAPTYRGCEETGMYFLVQMGEGGPKPHHISGSVGRS